MTCGALHSYRFRMLIDALFIVILLVVLAFAATFIWHLFILRVPYIPTSHAVAGAMIDLAGLKGDETVFDLGAGDGRVLIEAKRRYPKIRAIAVEYVPTIWLLGKITIALSRQAVTLKLGDALKTDVSKADAIFLYVTPVLMAPLAEKFKKELRDGVIIVSNSFSLPGVQPQKTVQAAGKTIHRYMWKCD